MKPAAFWVEQAAPRRRFGLKGPRAPELLKQQGLMVPARSNSWTPLRAVDRDDSWNVIARLGHAEFFLEEQGDAPGIAALESRLSAESGAWPVLREDFALVLGGECALEALAEVCNVEFGALSPAQKPVVLTLMTGIGVLVLPQSTDAGTIYRIWCDPSFGSCLWDNFAEIAKMTTGRAE